MDWRHLPPPDRLDDRYRVLRAVLAGQHGIVTLIFGKYILRNEGMPEFVKIEQMRGESVAAAVPLALARINYDLHYSLLPCLAAARSVQMSHSSIRFSIARTGPW